MDAGRSPSNIRAPILKATFTSANLTGISRIRDHAAWARNRTPSDGWTAILQGVPDDEQAKPAPGGSGDRRRQHRPRVQFRRGETDNVDQRTLLLIPPRHPRHDLARRGAPPGDSNIVLRLANQGRRERREVWHRVGYEQNGSALDRQPMRRPAQH